MLLASMAATQAADDFIISFWCGPPPGDDIDKRYAEVAECGFSHAMVPCSGVSIEQNKVILEACKKHKLKYLLRDSRMLQFDGSAPQFKTNLNAIIADYAKYPALGGYSVTDEPGPGLFPQLAAVNQYLLQHDPKHLPFINLYPNYCPEWALGGPYEQHVDKYLTMVKPKLLSYDHYALMTDGSLRPIYFENLEIIRRQSLKHDVPFCFIFQITAHGGYRDPSEAELRWQINTSLAYGAKALMYFTYWTPLLDPLFKHSNGIIDAKGNRSPHFEEVKRLNHAVKAWAPTLMKLESTGVYHTGTIPGGAQRLPADAMVKLNDDAPFIVGLFRHEDGSDWIMVVNRDFTKQADTTLQLAKGVKRLRELPSTGGRLKSAKVRDGELFISLAPGAAKLFKVSR